MTSYLSDAMSKSRTFVVNHCSKPIRVQGLAMVGGAIQAMGKGQTRFASLSAYGQQDLS